jgi:hypothetical protein
MVGKDRTGQAPMEMETGRGNDDDDDGIWEKKGGSTGAFTESVGKDGDLSLVVLLQSGLRHRYGVASVVLGLPRQPAKGPSIHAVISLDDQSPGAADRNMHASSPAPCTMGLAPSTGTAARGVAAGPYEHRDRSIRGEDIRQSSAVAGCCRDLVAPIPVRGMGRVHLENPHTVPRISCLQSCSAYFFLPSNVSNYGCHLPVSHCLSRPISRLCLPPSTPTYALPADPPLGLDCSRYSRLLPLSPYQMRTFLSHACRPGG